MATSINNLKPEKCRDIYPAIAANANDLLKVSDLAAGNGKFGCATSLIILGAEEYSKAIIVLLHAHGINIFKINEAVKVFRDHKAKHEVASAFELLNLLAPIINIIEALSVINFKKPHGLLLIIPKLLTEISGGAAESKKVFTNLDWWERADQIKQNGFYVNYIDELINPKDLDKKQYDEAKTVVSRLKRSYRILNIIFSRYPKYKPTLVGVLNQGILEYNKRLNKKNIPELSNK